MKNLSVCNNNSIICCTFVMIRIDDNLLKQENYEALSEELGKNRT